MFPSDSVIEERLADLSDDRVAQMDATGADVQVMPFYLERVYVLQLDNNYNGADRSGRQRR